MLFTKRNHRYFPPLTNDCARELYQSKINFEVDSLYNVFNSEMSSIESNFSGLKYINNVFACFITTSHR